MQEADRGKQDSNGRRVFQAGRRRQCTVSRIARRSELGGAAFYPSLGYLIVASSNLGGASFGGPSANRFKEQDLSSGQAESDQRIGNRPSGADRGAA